MILDDIIEILNNNDKDTIDYDNLKSKIIEFKNEYSSLIFEKIQIDNQYLKLEKSVKSLQDAVINDQSVIRRLSILSIFSTLLCIILLIKYLSK